MTFFIFSTKNTPPLILQALGAIFTHFGDPIMRISYCMTELLLSHARFFLLYLILNGTIYITKNYFYKKISYYEAIL
ncbi:hypothetical protein HW35_02005 [Bacillus sp. X1(2014)]|nr:hypothetical protein HW35_02005 [Bacillus sp. X1(2014)]